MSEAEAQAKAEIRVGDLQDGTLPVYLSGVWRSGIDRPRARDIMPQIGDRGDVRTVKMHSQGVVEWDSGLLTFVLNLRDLCAEREIGLDISDLPDGAQRLFGLATGLSEEKGAHEDSERELFLPFVGTRVMDFCGSCVEVVEFLGESLLSLWRLIRGRAIFRPVDVWLLMQQTGAEALPIVSLISALVGMILAFVGAYQLEMFGAEIYIAAGVGIGMVREMAPMMTGILIAGRTGAAFAAQIGTMEVNEEIDALRTMGISPVDFLVMPRVLALGLMMPLLYLYANLLGIAGGALVGSGMFDIPLAQYLSQTWSWVGISDFVVGLVKSFIFGMVIASAGCLRGMQSGRSASAVGEATTSSVVTGIVAIIVIDSLAAVITTVMGF